MELHTIDKSNINDFTMLTLGEQNGFVLCRQGSLTLIMDDKPIVLHLQSLCILPAFIQIKVANHTDDLQAVMGTDDYDFVLSAMGEVTNTQNIVFIRFHPLVELTAEQMARIEELIDVTVRRLNTETELADKIVRLLVQVFGFEILDAYLTNHRQQPSQQNRCDVVYQNFILLLYQNFLHHRDVKFYAESLCLTQKYFSTIIRQQSGKSPSEWIELFVILKAKHLLSTTQKPVKEIADILSFPTQSFFCRYFRQKTGLTPIGYRKSRSAQ